MIQYIFNLCEEILEEGNDVILISENFPSVAQKIKKEFKDSFHKPIGMPLIGGENYSLNLFNTTKFELMAASVNYCYWYGVYSHNIYRPSASKMYKILESVFRECHSNYEEEFANRLRINRFPLSEQRTKHLKEIYRNDDFLKKVTDLGELSSTNNISIEPLIKEMIELFPGFADDIFLKRVFLFFMQLHRRFGWFSQEIRKLPVPADYHLPNVLRHYGCIAYSSKLSGIIERREIIPSGSFYEYQIRAATIMACRELSEQSQLSMEQIDRILFSHKHEVKTNIHLTVTTHY